MSWLTRFRWETYISWCIVWPVRLQRLSHCRLFLFSSLIASLCQASGRSLSRFFFWRGACLSRLFLSMVLYCVKNSSRSILDWTIRSESIRSWLKAAESMAFNFRKKNSSFCMCVALASLSQPVRHVNDGGPSEASQHPQSAALVRPVVSSLNLRYCHYCESRLMDMLE